MNRLQQLQAQRATADAARRSLYEQTIAAGAAQPGGLTSEQEASLQAADAQVAGIDRLIVAEQRRIELEAASAVPVPDAGPRPRVEVGAPNAAAAPWDGPAPLGAMLQAVRAAAAPGASIDPRLMAAASGGNTTVGSEGGFLVQQDQSQILMRQGVEMAQLLPLCDSAPISGNADGIEAPYIEETSRATGSRFGGVRVYRRKEAATVSSSKPSLERFECRLEDLMAIAYMTGRQLEDAPAYQSVMVNSFASEFAFKADDEIIRGSGVGEMQGLLTAAASVEQAIETGQTLANSDQFFTKNISNMWTRMPSRLKGGAVWLYNAELGPTLDHLSIVAGTAALEPRVVSYGPDGILRIKGRPALEVEQCAAPGTTSDFMLVNLMEYLTITKGGLRQDTSIHVRFLYDEQAFRFIVRLNGKPKWRTSVTPYKGSLSRSPFIYLAARS